MHPTFLPKESTKILADEKLCNYLGKVFEEKWK
jgi:hypothetical protein